MLSEIQTKHTESHIRDIRDPNLTANPGYSQSQAANQLRSSQNENWRENERDLSERSGEDTRALGPFLPVTVFIFSLNSSCRGVASHD